MDYSINSQYRGCAQETQMGGRLQSSVYVLLPDMFVCVVIVQALSWRVTPSD